MLRRTLYSLAGLFLVANVVAFFHAWRFTHFTEPGGTRPTENPEQLTTAQRLDVLLTGVHIPKPTNGPLPTYPVEVVTFASANGQLEAWYALPAQGPQRGTVALFHGYTSNKSKLAAEGDYFRHLGYAVLLVDQSGNGNSAGTRTTVGHHEAADVVAAVAYLRGRNLAHPADSLILYGVSMGAVAIMRAEAELGVRPTANILECPYGTMRQTAYNRFNSMHVPPFPLADMLVFWGGVQNNFWAFGLQGEEYARRISTPTLLLWGTADPRVTRAETDTIFDHLAGPKQRRYFAGAGHEPYWHREPAAWQGVIGRFLQAPGQ
ncbi:MAG: alpha/beta hydrolase [Janthinobacterium lividum]